MGLCRSGHFGTVGAGSPAAGGHGSGGVGLPGGGHPAVAVDIIVVTACVAWMVCDASVGVVGRYAPHECGHADIDAEAQVLGCVVHAAGAVEPNAMQVEGHVDFVAGVGIETVDPNLVVGGVDALHPDFVDEYVGGQLVLVATVNHQLVLIVQAGYCACCLAVGEIKDVLGCDSHRRHHQCQC